MGGPLLCRRQYCAVGPCVEILKGNTEVVGMGLLALKDAPQPKDSEDGSETMGTSTIDIDQHESLKDIIDHLEKVFLALKIAPKTMGFSTLEIDQD
ncbi:hypothetical protein VMCG_06695 [Cytospora schulzeri]|uniref:Uncharacterized protein n=1 Tax=Cytospora schulzeri TaxID=448051 RepID=A0A423W719_9PEZI|nr:hypothetical protein VMCG_06695 [Valsa malicola]